jgi:hypothetical protein
LGSPGDVWTGGGSKGGYVGAAFEAGIVAAGVAGQIQYSKMEFANGESATFRTAGAFIGGPAYGASYPATPLPGFSNTRGGTVAGLSLGVGGGATWSNAETPDQFAGDFNNWNLNVGLFGGTVSFGDNGIIAINAGIAKSWGLDISNYTTHTTIRSRHC